MAALNGQRTFAQIVAEIDSHLFNQGSSSTTSYPTNAMIKNIVNKWYKRVVSSAKYQWATGEGTISTVIGTARITMPDVNMWPENFNIRSISQNIPVYTRQAFLASYPSGWTNVGQGIPLIAVEAPPASNNAKQYDLWPIPNAVYTINYDGFIHATPLSADGDYSIIPPEYDDILVHGPVSECFVMLADQRADYHQGEAESILKRLWKDNEDLISTLNTVRGYDENSTTSLVFPYRAY